MPDPRVAPVAVLLRHMVDALADYTEAITLTSVDAEDCTTFSVVSDPRDTGKIIGREGRNAASLRVILDAIGRKQRWKFNLIIVEDGRGQDRKAL